MVSVIVSHQAELWAASETKILKLTRYRHIIMNMRNSIRMRAIVLLCLLLVSASALAGAGSMV